MSGCANETPLLLEKNLTEEKKTDIEVSAVKPAGATPIVAAPQATPAIVEPTKEAAPAVVSQAPPIPPSEPKPVVVQASSVVAAPLGEKK